MKQFGGFPAKMRFTAVPEPFFGHVLPDIQDIAELKVILTIFRTIYGKRGYLRFVSLRELTSDVALMSGLTSGDSPPDSRLAGALENAVKRGVILQLTVEASGAPEGIYFLNTEADRRIIQRIENGEIALPDMKVPTAIEIAAPEKAPDIFGTYEQNIGLITPMIADELRDAQKLYPEAWIEEAIGEAAKQNKRKWSYISAILERWHSEGRTSGPYRGDLKADPDKYVKGKYGHMVRR